MAFFFGKNMETYSVNPIKVRMKESEKGVIYQSIVAMGFRSRQINDFIKSELNVRMADVAFRMSGDVCDLSALFHRCTAPPRAM